MKLVVGLGNPGRKYQATRHNVGFDTLREIARSANSPKPKSKFDAEVLNVEIEGHSTLLLWPQTYMNLSGTSVGKACGFYQLASEDLLVVCDDFHLPVGKLRFRSKGSSGGQQGLQDIINRLGSDAFARLRIGIGPLPPDGDAAQFVLSRFSRAEGAEIEAAVGRAAEAVADWVREGTSFCMNQYN